MSRAVLLVVLVVVAVFGQTLFAGYVWDDVMLIEFNEHLLDPDAVTKSLTWHFWDTSVQTGVGGTYWRPLAKLSHAVLYRVDDAKPWPYHLFNIVLHALNSVLVAVWARRRLLATGLAEVSGFAAMVAGLVFALHPSRYEVVGWISCSTELIFGLFVLLAAIAFEARSWWGLLAVAGAAFSKETVVVLPVLFACDAFLRKEVRQRLAFIIASVGVVGGVWSLRSLLNIALPVAGVKPGLLAVVERVLGTLAKYTLRTFVPTDVTVVPCDYEQFKPGDFDVPVPVVVLGVVLFIGWVALGITGLRNQKVKAWLGDALWWLVPLGPVLQIREVPAPMMMSDRFLYVPVMGVAVLTARLLLTVGERSQRPLRLGLAGLAVAAITMLSLGLPAYETNQRFFEREFSMHPGHTFTAEVYARALDASKHTYAAQQVLETVLARKIPEHSRFELVSLLAATYERTLRDNQPRELRQVAAYFDGILKNQLDGLHVGEKFWPVSEEAFGKVDRSRSEDARYFQGLLFGIRARLRQPDELLRLLARTRAKEPSPSLSLELARQLAIADRWVEATLVLREDGAKYPQLEREPLTAIIREAAAARPQAPTSALTWALSRSSLYVRLGSPGRARQELAPFIAEYRSDERLLDARVQVEIADVDYDSALALVDEALNDKPGDEGLLSRKQELSRARDLWKKAMELELEASRPLGL